MLRVGVIGYGYWGPNLVRNFYECPSSTVTMVSDLSEKQLARINGRYPTIETTTDHRTLINSSKVDAVVIATPVRTHFDLAMEALTAGKHVLVEKPFTETSAQARELMGEAERRGLTILVDHTFIYTGAVRKLKELIDKGELGRIYYYDSERVNLGLIQPDVNVIWDLAVHDLAILNFLIPRKPSAVSATGMSHIPGKPANVGYLSLFFDHDLIAHINVNWLAPVKLRRTLIGGDVKMAVYDDLEPSEKIKIYDKGVHIETREQVYQTLVGYRTGDMYAPQLDMTEALAREAQHFVACIESGSRPESGPEAGLYVVKVLEAATASMERRGQTVEIEWAQ